MNSGLNCLFMESECSRQSLLWARRHCPVSSVSLPAQQWVVWKWSIPRSSWFFFFYSPTQKQLLSTIRHFSSWEHFSQTLCQRSEAACLFFLHECSYFVGESDKITAGQNTLAWVNINRSSSLFLLDPCAWKQWVVGHFISRKRVRLPVHIVSMMAIYFAGSGTTPVCVVEWGLIDKNSRKDTSQFLMLLRDAALTDTAAWQQRIPIILGRGRGTCCALWWTLSALLSVYSPTLLRGSSVDVGVR